MNIDDRNVHDLVFSDPLPGEERLAALRREVVDEFDYRRKKNVVAVTLYVLACLPLLLGGVWWLTLAEDTKTMLLAFFLMMAGLESSVLVKLWFWVVDSRDVMSREIKQVQLQLAALAARPQDLPARNGNEEAK